MIVEVDQSSSVPPFEQLRAQIADLAATGQIAVGARLPTVRGLAADLALAPGTVARAYRELEQEGVIETRGRHGTFVCAVDELPEVVRQRQLAQAAREFAVRAQALAVPTARALEAVKQAWAG